MARRKFVCGNWKMNMMIDEAKALVEGIKPKVAGLEVDVAVAPPFTALHAVAGVLGGSSIRLAAQNCHFETKGAIHRRGRGADAPRRVLQLGDPRPQ